MLVIRNSECKGKEKALEKVKRVYEKEKSLGEIRLKSTVISSEVERSPNEWYEQGQTKKYILSHHNAL